MFNSNKIVTFILLIGRCILVTQVKSENQYWERHENIENEDLSHHNDESGGINLGQFESYDHGLAGEVFILDDRTFKITGLLYDGEGPAAWFLIGKTDRDTLPEFGELKGIIIPDEDQNCGVLKRYGGEDITLKLPDNVKFGPYNFISMYCFRFIQNFGYVKIPRDVTLKNGTASEYECDQDDPKHSIL